MATREVVLSDTLLPGQTVYLDTPCPLTGKITQVVREWPDGCNFIVDLAVGHSDIWVLPHLTETYVALNDATPVINVDEPVKKNEAMWMRGRNRDAGFPHALVVTFVVEGEE